MPHQCAGGAEYRKESFENMSEAVKLCRLREAPEYLEQASRWFSEQWGIAQTEYAQSMRACLAGARIPQWYFAVNGERRIVAGAGVIENDFQPRTDLSPNLCALYVEPALRGRGLAARMLAFARQDMHALGIARLYLITDHTQFYEHCGWEFLCPVTDNEGVSMRIYTAPTHSL